MDRITFYTPDAYTDMLNSIQKVPFAKVENGYQFAYWVYELNNGKEKQDALRAVNHGEKALALFEEAQTELKSILVTEDDYLAWAVHKKESGGIKRYHEVMHNLAVRLMLLTIDETAEEVQNAGHGNVEDFYSIPKSSQGNSGRQIMNRNNPFSDVTIKNQQFFYKTADGETETLFFNTNNMVDKVDKNGWDMLTMRPGFSVTKEHGAVQRPLQKVTFSNSTTESIVGDEDHIYIHID